MSQPGLDSPPSRRSRRQGWFRLILTVLSVLLPFFGRSPDLARADSVETSKLEPALRRAIEANPGRTYPVIVTGAPARSSSERNDRGRDVDRKVVGPSGQEGRLHQRLPLVNGVAAEMSGQKILELSGQDGVQAIAIDRLVRIHQVTTVPLESATATATSTPTGTAIESATATATGSATTTQTATAASSATATPSASATPSPTATASPTASASPTPTATLTATPSTTVVPTASGTPSATAVPTETSLPSSTPTAVATPTPLPTAAPSESATATGTAVASATAMSAVVLVGGTLVANTATPTETAVASATPTGVPPTGTPTSRPTETATLAPTDTPIPPPTGTSTPPPTGTSTPPPTDTPTSLPTGTSTSSPTESASPTATASSSPSATASPTAAPTGLASVQTLSARAPRIWSDYANTGQGVTVAVLDSGIQPSSDLPNAVFGIDLVTNSATLGDAGGHGSHVAGIIGGNGALSNGVYKGISPDARLISVKVADDTGTATYSSVIKGIQWVIANRRTYNIRVMNLSLGATSLGTYKNDPLAAAVEMAWFSGIVVVSSAGNDAAINVPANDPYVVAVGALDQNQTESRSDDQVAPWSARGPTIYDGLAKPDLVAGGRRVISLRVPGSYLDRRSPTQAVGDNYFRLSGTSMSAPVVSGVVALVLAANPGLTPNQVKYVLTESARPVVGFSANEQGAGQVDADEAIDLVRLGIQSHLANRGQRPSDLFARSVYTLAQGAPVAWRDPSYLGRNWSAWNWQTGVWDAATWDNLAWEQIAWERSDWTSVTWESLTGWQGSTWVGWSDGALDSFGAGWSDGALDTLRALEGVSSAAAPLD